MNIEQCKAEITRHEGKVLEIYEDSLGYKTLGIGHLCQPETLNINGKWELKFLKKLLICILKMTLKNI